METLNPHPHQRLAWILVLLALLIAPDGNAATLFTPVSPLPSNTVKRGDGPYTTGNAFTVADKSLVIDTLGVMDVGNDGFYAPVQVGLWSADGSSLLASVTVSSADPFSAGYRYHALAAPVTLAAGVSYLIGARVGSGIEWFYDALPNTLTGASSAIFLGDSCFSDAASLAAPTNNSGFVARWAAANATFTASGEGLSNGYSTTLNPGSSWGAWDGWGVSLCWWANVFGTRDDLADVVFTTNYTTLNGFPLPGLGMNIARYNAGGCSTNSAGGATMLVSASIPAYRQMPGYWLDWNNSDPASSSWNWSADAGQRAMLLKAKMRGANFLELFSNSPMWWMCDNHNPSGAPSGSSDNLQSWNYDQHAIYLATVARYALDNWGITFNSVEPFNEPSANWWTASGTQEGCHFATSTQATVIGYLRSELNSRGLISMNIAASDENTYDGALSTWNSFSSAVQGEVDQLDTHGYQYTSGRRDLLFVAATGKKLWNSEYGDGDGTGISMAANLNLDFRWLHPTGWCYWQALDSGGWGLIQSNPGGGWIGPANRKYFVLAQYTRHIRSGMTIIDGGEGNTLSAYDPVARKLVIVTVNYNTAQWISYNLQNFPSATGPIQGWVSVTGTGPNYQPSANIALNQGAFKAWFPLNSIQTFEIQNVDLNPPAAPSTLSAIAGVNQVSLTWTAATAATNYVLQRKVVGGSYATMASQSRTNFIDHDVVGDSTYTYVVSAVNGAGASAPSASVSATPHSPPKLEAQFETSAGNLTLSWPAWAVSYILYGSASLTPPFQWLPVTNAVQTDGATFYLVIRPRSSGVYFYSLKESSSGTAP